MSLNKTILIGNVGSDPEGSFSQSGNQITRISLATNETWKDKTTGEKKTETEWHKVVFFGRLAEIASKYLSKGNMIYVEGKIKTNKYTDKDGAVRYSTSIIANNMQMLGSKKDSANTTETDHQEIFEEDIPF